MSEVDLFNIKELCHKIVKTKIHDFPLIISGSTPIDLLLGRMPNDLDVYFPEKYLPEVRSSLRTMLTSWGVGDGLNDSELQVVQTDTEYGVTTLRYDILGTYKEQRVRIQFISYNWDLDYFYDFVIMLLQTFQVNTSQAFLYESDLGLLAAEHRHDFRVTGDGKVHLTSLMLKEGANKIASKTVGKYMQYCTRPFVEVPSIPLLGPMTFLYNGDRLPFKINKSLCNSDYKIYGSKTFDSLPDPKPSPKSTGGEVPLVWTHNHFRPSSIGSLPSDWPSPSGLAPELQSTGEQSEGAVQEIRGATPATAIVDELNEFMARTATPIPPSRSFDTF